MLELLDFELFEAGDGNIDPQTPREQLLLRLARGVVLMQQGMMTAPQLNALAAEQYNNQGEGADATSSLSLEQLEALLPMRTAQLAQWWKKHKSIRSGDTSLALLALRLIHLEGLAFASANAYVREAISSLLLVSGEHSEVHSVWLSVGGQRIRIPGTYASKPDLPSNDPAHADLLVHSVAMGLWFDRSPQRVARQLCERLLDGGPWYDLLSESQQQALARASAYDCELELQELPGSMIGDLLGELRRLQDNTERQVMAKVAVDTQRMVELDASARLDSFVRQAQKHASQQMAAYRHSLLPEWRRNLHGDDLQAYLRLEQQMLHADGLCIDQLGHLKDVESYASHVLSDYLQEYGGIIQDPAAIYLEIGRRFALDGSAGERPRVSLLNWVLKGGYRGGRLTVKVLDPDLETVLGDDFMQRMNDTLDLRVSYIEEVTACYQQAQTRSLMRDAIAARLALAGLAARFKGAAPEACDMFDSAMRDDMQGEGIRAGLICIDGRESALKHLLYMENGTTHLLYAPGSPDGDFLVYPSARAMALAIGGWTGKPGGIEYLIEQSALAERDTLSRELVRVSNKTSLWSSETVMVQFIESRSWPDVLRVICERRCIAMREDLMVSTPQWYLDADANLRRALSDTDQELEQVVAAYHETVKLKTLREFARKEVAEWINRVPGNRGGWIDPDTVTVRLGNDKVLTLTQVVLKGHDTNFNFAGFARIGSSVGQRVEHLNRAVLAGYIRSAKLGERYIAALTSTFLDRSAPGHANQRELHRLLVSLKMLRDLLTQMMLGQLPYGGPSWLLEVVAALPDAQIVPDCEVSHLKIKGARIEGAYRLNRRSDRNGDAIFYLPDAPYGPAFRSREHVVSSWSEDQLGDYFYKRVAYEDQPIIGSLNEQVMRDGSGGKEKLMMVTRYFWEPGLRDMGDDLVPRVRRLIADADRDTVSVAERVSSVVVEWVIVAAGILTIPIPPANMLIGLGCGVRSFVYAGQAWRDGDGTAFLTYLATGSLGVFASSGALGGVLSALAQPLRNAVSVVSQPMRWIFGMACQQLKDAVGPAAPLSRLMLVKVGQALRHALGKPEALRAATLNKVSFAEWLIDQADKYFIDVASELGPALYDGFDKELLDMVGLSR
ncbi:hypothetical protein ACIQSO_12125 [Pseudomonas putida]|uniref:hypothetical protein n=1 Tax=Pseudomonas putida TaxID=303 RepID=UPI00383BF4A8